MIVTGTEAVTTPAGSFQAFRIRSTLHGEDGRPTGRAIHVWLSDTPARVPVKIESELAVGSFVLTLNQVNPGQ